MRIFVCEHVTGGAMSPASPSPGLLHEADLMVRTLVADLAARPGVELLTIRDARLAPLPGVEALSVGAGDDPRELVAHGIGIADAVWPIAPETDHALEALTLEVLRRGRILLGCRPEAVRIAASKRQTVATLTRAGIAAVPTFAAADPLPDRSGRWVTKPDDGAGAEAVRLAEDRRTVTRRLCTDPGRLVAQPWLEGRPISLSLLCHDGHSRLICINHQRVQTVGESVRLVGIAVNAVSDPAGELAALGGRIAAALPGLWGYVGVDLILTPDGPVVLEVNPRLTTSYCGVGPALDLSVAALVLDLLEQGDGAVPAISPGSGTVVELPLEVSRGG
jgi:predicted ATP-grasp superfamily ATP-dependent carboligase